MSRIAGFTAAALAAAPVAAQDNAAAAVGPDSLSDFTLNGTVTRRPQPQPTAPVRTTAPAPATSRTSSPPTDRQATRPRPTGQPEPSTRAEPSPAQSVTVQLPPSEPPEQAPALETQPPPPNAGQQPAGPALGSQPGLTPLEIPADANRPIADDPWFMLPWLLLALLLGIGAAVYAWRQRSRPAYAAAGGAGEMLAGPVLSPLARPGPQPEPGPESAAPPRKPSPPPAPAQRLGPGAASTGIVSTRLRPWLEIEFVPLRCVVTDEKATIEFEVTAFNSGAAPAREVLLEACLFNAGPDQDAEIGAFFARPVGRGDRIPLIPQLKRVPLRSAVSLPIGELRQFEVEGRRLFVPLIGINALYSWSAGVGQTSVSYLLGRETKGEKMAPFRLDLGARQFRGLGARRHSLGIRR